MSNFSQSTETSLYKQLNYEPTEYVISEEIVKSLKNNYRDYGYNKSIKQEVLNICKREKISIIFKEYYNKDGSFDYIEFIPVIFLKTPKYRRLKGIQINMNDIQTELNDWVYQDLSIKTKKYIIKGREK